MDDLTTCALCDLQFRPAEHRRWVKDGFTIVRCPSCTLVFRSDLPAADELAAIYGPEYFTGDRDLAAQGYLDYTADADAHRANARARLRALEGLIGPGPLLDVGAAAGFFVDEARAQGWAARGVDLSTFMVEWGIRELGVPLEEGTIETVEVAHGSLHALTMWDYIEHSVAPRRELERARSLLRPGGILALSTGDVDSILARASGSRWHLLTPRHHNFYFSSRTLRELLARTGFAVTHMDHRGARYPVRYLLHKLSLSSAVDRIAARRLGELTVPVNLWDIVTVFARRAR